MSWGTDLWDGFDQVSNHTSKGIEFCEKYMHFIKERCQLENEYAAKLKKLVKNYQPKKKNEDGQDFTVMKGFQKMIHEVNDMAGQHENISECLQNNVIKQLQSLVQELKQDRKKCLQEGAKQANSLKSQLNELDKTKKKYEKAFNESEKASDNFKKADADINLSRAEVEKAAQIKQSKANQCEECKSDYAAELQKTNEAQSQHYNKLMPDIFKRLQDLDEQRTQRIKGFIMEGANIEKSVLPIINRCIEGMVNAANSIDHTEDSNIVIKKHKSGFVPPQDIPFEDLSLGNGGDVGNHTGGTPKNHNTVSKAPGTVKSKEKKRRGLGNLFPSKGDDTKEDFSHLPPNQQKIKLKEKIEGIKKIIAKETAERDGMLKMRDVYQHNPQLGDANSLDKQIETNAQKLDDLKKELQKYENYLSVATDGSVPSRAESFSNVSGKSVGVENASKASTPEPSRHSTTESSGSTEHHEASPAERHDSFDMDDDDDYSAIGTCKALYQFEATSDGSVPMSAGEELSILEKDQGDGWTQVQKSTGAMGFVPTSYIECTYYG